MKRSPFGFLVGLAFLAPSIVAGIGNAADTYSVAGANKYLAARDWNGLLSYSKRWTEARPDDPDAWYDLGNTLLNGFHQPAEAIGPLTRAAQLKPNWAEAWYFLGMAQQDAKQPRDAMDSLQRAKDLAPQKMLYWVRLGSAYTELGRFVDARSLFLESEDVAGPRASYTDWFYLGEAYHKLHEEVFAARAFQHSVKLNPSFGEGWNFLGIASEDAGNLQAAEKAYRQGAALGNEHAANNLKAVQGKIAAAEAAARNPPARIPNPYDPAKARQFDIEHQNEPLGHKSCNIYRPGC